MSMSSVGPTRRRQSDQIMRKIDKNIHQVPVPDGIWISICPTLDPLIIHITTLHVMTHQNPRPIRRNQTILESNRGPVKRVVEGVKVDTGFKVLEGLDRVGDGNGRLWWVERWGVEGDGLVAIGLRWRHRDEEIKRVTFFMDCVETVAGSYQDLAVNMVTKKLRDV